MGSTQLAASSDLPQWAVVAVAVLVAAGLALLGALELRRRERHGALIALSGVLALGALALAILRPVRIAAKESVVGARVVVLADDSLSMDLPDGKSKRTAARDDAITALREGAGSTRLATYRFGEAVLLPYERGAVATMARSDLGGTLRAIVASPDERPAAIVVVSDGRLDDPGENADDEALSRMAREVGVPIHTVATTRDAPRDASIRRVATVGAAVAHAPLPLRVEVGCGGGLACDELTVTARELREGGPPALLASAIVKMQDGRGVLDLTVTLEQAGSRILELAITPPDGDSIADNDRRLLTLHVSRERIRVLHVAGRPTYDTRALRQWLKRDASVDVVAFFILRTPADDPGARQDDLALIPFPVDELFSDHLPSFDAIVLQDFDAQPYGLERHLPAIARYAKAGGGVVMVGGPNSFVAGGYAGTPLAGVLPTALDASPGATAADPAAFVPEWTAAGLAAPLLAPLREIVGTTLPEMPGSNILEDVRPGSVALWTHPRRRTASGAPMPILAVGEQGDGRSIALAVDGGWLLEFSKLGERSAGRGHGALWDGLLGWLMRDPRYDPARLELTQPCVAGRPASLSVRPGLYGAATGGAEIEVRRLDADAAPVHLEVAAADAGARDRVSVPLPPLAAGGYVARLKQAGTSARVSFACERGGDEWADSRPDALRLERLARLSGGTHEGPGRSPRIRWPKPTVISAERHVAPVAPPWLWSTVAALALGIHWIVRRRAGLA